MKGETMPDDMTASAAAEEEIIPPVRMEVEDVLFAYRLYRELFRFRDYGYYSPVTAGERVAFNLLLRALQELPEEEVGTVNCVIDEIAVDKDMGAVSAAHCM
jgi:hypothetical protein